jgi:SAM-dependent methyltransferase
MTRGPRSVPGTASIATSDGGDKLCAPAAARNEAALRALLAPHAPARGRALELASGTGQHVVAFARAFPGLHWQPSDVDPARLRSIDARAAEAALDNIAPARLLDATQPGWSAAEEAPDLIVLVNLLHLISDREAATLVTEAAQALTPGGRLVVYGPFMRSGVLTSEGDRTFHASLVGHDPAIGYKDDLAVQAMATAAGLSLLDRVEMPANNLAFVWARETAAGPGPG